MVPLHGDTLVIDRTRASSNLLADLLESNDPGVPVATCGDRNVADLVWRLMEVRVFWGHIIGERPCGPESYAQPTRLQDSELAAGPGGSPDRLVELLMRADSAGKVWSWSDDHTVGFSIRRQIHESLVHCIDGCAASGDDPSCDPVMVSRSRDFR